MKSHKTERPREARLRLISTFSFSRRLLERTTLTRQNLDMDNHSSTSTRWQNAS